MNEAQARARLEDLVAASVFPTLTTDQVTRLLREARRTDSEGTLPSATDEWAPSTAYAVNDLVVPTVRNDHIYKVTVSDGLSGVTEPTWPLTAGGSVTLDGVTYQEDSAGSTAAWIGTYDFHRAAAEGWSIKAGLVTNRHAFGSNQGNYNPEQVFEHCQKMADYYRSKVVSTIQFESGRWDGSGHINAAHFEDAV